MTLRDLQTVLQKTKLPVYHYEAVEVDFPYIVYQEYAETYSFASGSALKENIMVEIYFYTKTEFDPAWDLLKQTLMENKVFFSTSISYEGDEVTMYNLSTTITHEYV